MEKQLVIEELQPLKDGLIELSEKVVAAVNEHAIDLKDLGEKVYLIACITIANAFRLTKKLITFALHFIAYVL